MIRRPIYTEVEHADNRRKWLEDLESYRIGIRAIRDMDDLIRVLEENAGSISEVMLDMEVNDAYSPSLQATFDETMDILDYLKANRLGT